MSFTVANSHVGKWAQERTSGMLRKLLSCTYCMSHWFAGIAAGWYGMNGMDWVYNSFAIVAMSMFFTTFMLFLAVATDSFKEKIRGKKHGNTPSGQAS